MKKKIAKALGGGHAWVYDPLMLPDLTHPSKLVIHYDPRHYDKNTQGDTVQRIPCQFLAILDPNTDRRVGLLWPQSLSLSTGLKTVPNKEKIPAPIWDIYEMFALLKVEKLLSRNDNYQSLRRRVLLDLLQAITLSDGYNLPPHVAAQVQEMSASGGKHAQILPASLGFIQAKALPVHNRAQALLSTLDYLWTEDGMQATLQLINRTYSAPNPKSPPPPARYEYDQENDYGAHLYNLALFAAAYHSLTAQNPLKRSVRTRRYASKLMLRNHLLWPTAMSLLLSEHDLSDGDVGFLTLRDQAENSPRLLYDEQTYDDDYANTYYPSLINNTPAPSEEAIEVAFHTHFTNIQQAKESPHNPPLGQHVINHPLQILPSETLQQLRSKGVVDIQRLHVIIYTDGMMATFIHNLESLYFSTVYWNPDHSIHHNAVTGNYNTLLFDLLLSGLWRDLVVREESAIPRAYRPKQDTDSTTPPAPPIPPTLQPKNKTPLIIPRPEARSWGDDDDHIKIQNANRAVKRRPHTVSAHPRELPPDWKASQAAKELYHAIYHVPLPEGFTFVSSYNTGLGLNTPAAREIKCRGLHATTAALTVLGQILAQQDAPSPTLKRERRPVAESVQNAGKPKLVQ